MKIQSLGLFCLCLMSVLMINAQAKHETFLTVIEKLPNNISAHVPKGDQVLDTTFGNLNFDNYLDLIIVFPPLLVLLSPTAFINCNELGKWFCELKH